MADELPVDRGTVLVAGSTGYVGGRLVPELLDAGFAVRVVTRSTARAQRYEWSDDVEVVRGDMLDRESLTAAFDGCIAAFYLVHSMGTGEDFADTDARAAANFRDAADAAGVGRIVYLGGMGTGTDLSAHLESRHHVGEILASGPTPTTELRAAVIIGSGSLSFEMLRYLTEVLPVMVTPAGSTRSASRSPSATCCTISCTSSTTPSTSIGCSTSEAPTS